MLHHRGPNEVFPGLVALTDSSEQLIQQPKRSDMGELHYVKVKTHTVKVQYITSFDGLIVHKTATRRPPPRLQDIQDEIPNVLRWPSVRERGKFEKVSLRLPATLRQHDPGIWCGACMLPGLAERYRVLSPGHLVPDILAVVVGGYLMAI